jgi:hypothetical protein
MTIIVDETHLGLAVKLTRECVRPFPGYSKRHLRRKAEAAARAKLKAAAKAAAAASKAEVRE